MAATASPRIVKEVSKKRHIDNIANSLVRGCEDQIKNFFDVIEPQIITKVSDRAKRIIGDMCVHLLKLIATKMVTLTDVTKKQTLTLEAFEVAAKGVIPLCVPSKVAEGWNKLVEEAMSDKDSMHHALMDSVDSTSKNPKKRINIAAENEDQFIRPTTILAFLRKKNQCGWRVGDSKNVGWVISSFLSKFVNLVCAKVQSILVSDKKYSSKNGLTLSPAHIALALDMMPDIKGIFGDMVIVTAPVGAYNTSHGKKKGGKKRKAESEPAVRKVKRPKPVVSPSTDEDDSPLSPDY